MQLACILYNIVAAFALPIATADARTSQARGTRGETGGWFCRTCSEVYCLPLANTAAWLRRAVSIALPSLDRVFQMCHMA